MQLPVSMDRVMPENKMKKLIEMLKRHEGVETHAYECSEGKVTVGVGRNIDRS